MRFLCIIPVRGGSKGLKRKNALEIKTGISLLEWTVHQAHSAYPKEDVVISTEDFELSKIAKDAGARVFERPMNLAQDSSTTSDVVYNVLDQLSDPSAYEAIAILQVTSALRTREDILKSIEMMQSKIYDSVISAYESLSSHPAKQYFINEIEGNKIASSFVPLLQHANRQERPKVFQRNGAIFTVTKDFFLKTSHLWGGRIGIVDMPFERSIDIDTADDLKKARLLLK